MILNSKETQEILAQSAEEKLDSMMGEIPDVDEQNISLDPLEKRIKGKENKKFDDPKAEPKDRSKPMNESVTVPSGTALDFIHENMESINREMGEVFYQSGIPISFIREEKNFSGMFLFGDSFHLLVEFEVAEEGDIITSISKFSNDLSSDQAEFTVEFTEGASFEENIRNAALLMEGGSSLEESTLREAKKDEIMAFLQDADSNKPVSGLYRDYLRWANEQGKEEVSPAHFRNTIKALGVAPSAPQQQVEVPGLKHYQDTFEEPVEYDEFEKEIMQNQVMYKYEMMGELVKKIVMKDPQYKNVFIYGVGGIGKTYTVEQVINKYADMSTVVTLKGAISGFTGLLQVLWENRDGKILVFDDNDGILTGTQQNAANILKLAMESSDPRIVTYSRFKRGKQEESLDAADVHEGWTEEDWKKFNHYKKLVPDDYAAKTVNKMRNNIAEPEEEASSKDYHDPVQELMNQGYSEEEANLELGIVDTDDDYDMFEEKSLIQLKSLLEGKFSEEEYDDSYDLEADEISGIESSGNFDLENFKKTYKGELDPDIDPAFGMTAEEGVPDKFQFKSRIIFISNLMKVPQPLFDRCHSVGLLLTKEQILDLIDSKLGNLMRDVPQVTLEDKKEVLKFMRTYLHRAGKTPTFRGFQQLMALYTSDHPNSKKLMYLAYTAGAEMSTVLR